MLEGCKQNRRRPLGSRLVVASPSLTRLQPNSCSTFIMIVEGGSSAHWQRLWSLVGGRQLSLVAVAGCGIAVWSQVPWSRVAGRASYPGRNSGKVSAPLTQEGTVGQILERVPWFTVYAELDFETTQNHWSNNGQTMVEYRVHCIR